jgi:uncharacterized membrane protein YbhN (UPF0104 family)
MSIEPATTPPSARAIKRLHRVSPFLWEALRWGVTLLILLFLVRQLVLRWGDLQAHFSAFSWQWGALSLLGLGGYLLLVTQAWRRLIISVGAWLSYKDAFRFAFYANPAKYIPGGVWNMVGRVVLCEREGIAPAKTSLSLMLELGYQIPAAWLVGLLALPALLGRSPQALWAITALIILIPIGLHPRLLNTVLTLGERLSKRPLPRISGSYRFALTMVGFYAVVWLVTGLGFAALAQALSPTPLSLLQVGLLVGGFSFAWTVGVFSIFAPSGLGVREGALALLLAPYFPPAWPLGVALAARLWLMSGEAIAFLAAIALGRLKKPAPERIVGAQQ